MSDEEEPKELLTLDHLKGLQTKKKRKVAKNEFIDDEAELSGDDEVSEDEDEFSDDDQVDLDLVDNEAPELDSDEEEAVRGFYHKQLESEDKRTVLLMQEQLEDKQVGIGQRRRRKFHWQTKELMDNSLRRHYDPDDDDSQGGGDSDYDDDDEVDYSQLKPRLRRPTTEALLLGSTKITSRIEQIPINSSSNVPTSGVSIRSTGPTAGPSVGFSDDSNSNTMSSRPIAGTSRSTGGGGGGNPISDINRFLFRDKELVQALSTKETVIVTREEKDKIIQREIKRVHQSKSIFDQLYS